MRLKKITCLISLFMMVMALQAQSQSVRDLVNTIRDAYFQAQYDKVVQSYEQLVQHPDWQPEELSTEVFENVIISCFYLDKKDEAESVVKQLLMVEPEYKPSSVRIPPDISEFIKDIDLMSKVVITSVPKNSTVYIDGVKQEKSTPNSYAILAGQHELRVEPQDPANYQVWTSILTVQPGEEPIIQAEHESLAPRKSEPFIETPGVSDKEKVVTKKWYQKPVVWIVGAAAVGGGIYAVVSSDSENGGGNKPQVLPKPPAVPSL